MSLLLRSLSGLPENESEQITRAYACRRRMAELYERHGSMNVFNAGIYHSMLKFKSDDEEESISNDTFTWYLEARKFPPGVVVTQERISEAFRSVGKYYMLKHFSAELETEGTRPFKTLIESQYVGASKRKCYKITLHMKQKSFHSQLDEIHMPFLLAEDSAKDDFMVVFWGLYAYNKNGVFRK